MNAELLCLSQKYVSSLFWVLLLLCPTSNKELSRVCPCLYSFFLPFSLWELINVHGYIQTTVTLLILQLMSPVQTSRLGSIFSNYTTIHNAFLLGCLMPLNKEQNGTLGKTYPFLGFLFYAIRNPFHCWSQRSLIALFHQPLHSTLFQVLYILSPKYISIPLLLYLGEGYTISPSSKKIDN